MSSGSTNNLLVEILTEELPPINLEQDIGNNFSNNLAAALKSFTSTDSKITSFISPRRFGCIISNVIDVEANSEQLRKGPAINSGLKDGNPTPALLGFAKSCNKNIQDLEQKDDGYFYAKVQTQGRKLSDILTDAISQSLKKLPIAKNMRWGNNDYSFVRPVHNILILHGDKVIANHTPILGLIPNNYTFGHRIMSDGKINIKHADNYMTDINEKGKVIVNFASRREIIQNQLENKAQELNLQINNMPGLLDEVTALVEYPVILCGEFNQDFLQVPQECLILSMAKNQKYFALLDSNNKLSNKFLFVANIDSKNPQIIINGNEKVLAARLQDAKFFFEVDKKHELGTFVEKLSSVVYHNKLGSQQDRIIRLQNIASEIAPLLNVNQDTARSTAYLLKADLASEMVGEFPELQGVMGKYYAKVHGESDEVANAIEQHYYPRFSGDELPNSNLATVMSLTDKLETLVGIWGIGLVPTGDKDPFALRRAALGVIRILLRENLDIKLLLSHTYEAFANKYQLNPKTVDEVYQFILNRLENYLTTDYTINCVRSILQTQPRTFVQIPGLLEKLNNFAQNEENKAILQANKRIENILGKSGNKQVVAPDIRLAENKAEEKLIKMLQNDEPDLYISVQEKNWDKYFKILSNFNQPVTDFFDNVMVMVEDPKLQQNRIAILNYIYYLANLACKLSELG